MARRGFVVLPGKRPAARRERPPGPFRPLGRRGPSKPLRQRRLGLWLLGQPTRAPAPPGVEGRRNVLKPRQVSLLARGAYGISQSLCSLPGGLPGAQGPHPLRTGDRLRRGLQQAMVRALSFSDRASGRGTWWRSSGQLPGVVLAFRAVTSPGRPHSPWTRTFGPGLPEMLAAVDAKAVRRASHSGASWRDNRTAPGRDPGSGPAGTLADGPGPDASPRSSSPPGPPGRP
jgi:hypothetical protein